MSLLNVPMEHILCFLNCIKVLLINVKTVKISSRNIKRALDDDGFDEFFQNKI